ncbi:MFS transporter [Microbacterium sp. HD4P20]|uniref:MFS transporter n=1 Tax=Microbacterium sp. HD4P20 TaxID=2864874 RepID=UPI001C63F7A2|nr:MFS transporter [Microbacterium sp. HD4P20]MCP2635712.1 MFS transporter [Microbacterium sp. HD4P20]
MRSSTRAPRSWHAVGVTLTILLTAAVLRSPIVAVAPVAREVQDDLAVTAGTVGLLTSIPVLAFAVCAPLAVALIRRCGADLALTIALAGSVAGCLVRSLGGLTAAMVGTAMIGLFLTVGNVVVPIIIKREYPPARVPFMTGVYTSAINVGTMVVTLATAPLAAATDWRVALAVWGGFGLAALATWIGTHGLRALAPAPAPQAADADGAARSAAWAPTTWFLAVAFAGQAFAFYATTAWLPSLLMDDGMPAAQAGAVASVFQLAGIAGALGIPLLAHRTSLATSAIVLGVAWLAIPLGFLFSPGAWLMWCVVGGLAQGAGITWVFIMLNALGGDDRAVAGRSGTVQAVGYAGGASGPIVLGMLHESTGSWAAPLLVLLAAVLALLVAGWASARPLSRAAAR